MAVYSTTRDPDEESAIAPYGSDGISVYNQIAGPSMKLNQDGTRKISDAGLDIDSDAIRHLQVNSTCYITCYYKAWFHIGLQLFM